MRAVAREKTEVLQSEKVALTAVVWMTVVAWAVGLRWETTVAWAVAR